MKASVVYSYNPFNKTADRTIKVVKRVTKISTLDPKWSNKPYICLYNGEALLRKDWEKTKVGNDDVVTFIALPQGGGGSNPLRAVMMIAIAMVAPYIAAPMLGYGFGAGGVALMGTATGFAGAIATAATAAIGMVGNMLVNAIVPPPKPPSTQSMREAAASSPTYSLGAQGNSARLGAAIPVFYGQHRIFPDFAAQPYVNYMSNEQYLYQLFCIGQGECDIESINIEDTAITNFDGVQTEVVTPGNQVTLFPTNIVTSAEVGGQEALQNDPLGGFIANAAGTTVSRIFIDIVCPNGLFYANDEGELDGRSVSWTVQARQVDNLGNPLTAYTTVDAASITEATNTPIRRSYEIQLPAKARWQVSLTRTNAKDTSNRASNVLTWAGLRAWVDAVQNYGDVTMLAVKMKASNSLSGQSNRKINVVATRRIATWNPTTGYGAKVPTKSVAWAALDACKNSVYGAGLTDAQINLDQLYALDTVLSTRQDYFNAVFDSQLSFWEALTQICRAGRTVPVMQHGVINFVRDTQQSLHTALFTPRNIVKNSLKIEYLVPTEDTVDAVEVEFFNEDTWKTDTILATLPGSTSDKPAKVKLFGVTNRSQAWREGMYIAAQNRYRRKIITFDTELDGHIPAYGDLVAIAHDMPSWGVTGEITHAATVADGTELTLTESPAFEVGQTHYVILRRFDGSVSGPHVATAVSEFVIKITDALDFSINTDLSVGERTYFSFGKGEKYRQRAKVMSVRPSNGMRVQISCANENDLVHNADGGSVPVNTPTTWPSTGVPMFPQIPTGSLLLASVGTPSAPAISMSWGAASGATHYRIEYSIDGNSWTDVGFITATSYRISGRSGSNHVRVTPVSPTTEGYSATAFISLQGDMVIPNAVPPQVIDFTATSGLLVNYLDWTNPNYSPNTNMYEVYRAPGAETNPNNGIKIHVARRDANYFTDDAVTPGEAYNYWVRIISNTNVAGPFSVMQTATPRKIGVGDTDGTIVGGSAPDETPPEAVTGVTVSTRLGTNTLKWTNPNDSTLARVQIWRNTADDRATATMVAAELGDSFVDTNVVVDTTYYYWLRTIDFAGNLGPFEPTTNTTTYSVTTIGIAYDDLDPNVQFVVEIQNGEVEGAMIAAGAVTAEKTKVKKHMIY